MRELFWIGVASVLLCGSAAAQTTVVRGARIHPISGPEIEGGVVVIEGGTIREVGPRGSVSIPSDATAIDAEGLDLWPGLVDAMTYLGLQEIGSVRGTVDQTEVGSMNPNARVEVAINASSLHLPVTRANGTLLAAVHPYGSLVPGKAAVIALDGWTWEELLRKASLGLVIEWPVMGPKARPSWDDDEEKTPGSDWEERLARLDEMLEEGHVYARARSRGPAHREADVRWEALGPVVDREMPVWIRAGNLAQIRAALEWTERHGLSMVLIDGSDGTTGDAWRAAEELARRDIPVVVQTTRVPARRYEPYDTAFQAPAVLQAAGVRIAFGSWSSAHSRSLPQEAARAVAYGLPREAAERALTLGACEIFGLEEKYGSLEPGKSATMILVEGDLLETRMHVVRAWIDGREIELESHHTELWKKWSSRPQGNTISATHSE
jgi:imidazolonepropionase-like amidohydrolase